ncbi:MAG: SDR family NAD(P)-dependent oxidoreductase [Pseudomonadota bacterium]
MDDFNGHFAGKVCVITGAASGIGRALAIQLIAGGALVALSDKDTGGLEQTVALAGAEGSNSVRCDHLDVADGDAIAVYATTVEDSLGSADYLFNVAGLTRYGSFAETSLEAHAAILDVNYWGVVRLCKAFLPQLIMKKGGIVNISSLFGLIGFPNQAHYCASKYAVRGFSETLAQELAQEGVYVGCVHPGGVDTAIIKNAAIDRADRQPTDHETMVQQFKEVARTSPASAATQILRATQKRRTRIVVGRDAKIISALQRLLPSTYKRIITRINRLRNRAEQA